MTTARILGFFGIVLGLAITALLYVLVVHWSVIATFFSITPLAVVLLGGAFLVGGGVMVHFLVSLIQSLVWLERVSGPVFSGLPTSSMAHNKKESPATLAGDSASYDPPPIFDQALLYQPPAYLKDCVLGDHTLRGILPSPGYPSHHRDNRSNDTFKKTSGARSPHLFRRTNPSLRDAQMSTDKLMHQLAVHDDIMGYIRIFMGGTWLATLLWLLSGAVGTALTMTDIGLGNTGVATDQGLLSVGPSLATLGAVSPAILTLAEQALLLTGFMAAGLILLGIMEALCSPLRRQLTLLFEGWAFGLVEDNLASSTHTPGSSLPGGAVAQLSYPSAVLTSLIESLESFNTTVVKSHAHQKELFHTIQGLADRIGSLTDQTKVEQQLMMKLAEGQIALQDTLQRFNDAALEGDLGFDKISKNHIKVISRSLQQLLDALNGGMLTRDIRQELRIISKTIGLTPSITSSTPSGGYGSGQSGAQSAEQSGAQSIGRSKSAELGISSHQSEDSGYKDPQQALSSPHHKHSLSRIA